MFGLFPRSHRKPLPAPARSPRPTLESLERRDCPSTISLITTNRSGRNTVSIMGRVFNTPSPGGLTVNLGGVVNGTATTTAYGTFSAVLPASALGTVTAATADGQSNVAQSNLSDPSQQISTFSYTEYCIGMFDFSGHVNGGYQGETVNLGGLQSLQGVTATVDANGNFSVCVQLQDNQYDMGNATAQAVDAWGQTSNLATDWVSQT